VRILYFLIAMMLCLTCDKKSKRIQIHVKYNENANVVDLYVYAQHFIVVIWLLLLLYLRQA